MNEIRMPEPRKRRAWGFEINSMVPSEFRDCATDKEAQALVMAMRYRGWVPVRQKQEDGTTRVWRYS